MIRTLRLAVAAALTAMAMSAGGCGGSDFAKETSKNTYYNAKYKLTVVAPDGWYVMNSAETRKMQDAGAKLAAGDNKDLKAALDASKSDTGAIFSFFRAEPGSVKEFNPSVVAAAEDVSVAPEVKTGRDYFDHVKQLMAQSSAGYNVKDGYGTRTIGGQQFDQMDLTMTINGTTVKQSYYAARHGDSAVAVIQSYDTDQDKADTDKVIDTIKLDWK